MAQLPLIHEPPPFCAYASGECDQDFSSILTVDGLFLFGSQPPNIASPIEAAVELLQEDRTETWGTWRDMDIAGQMVFCEICKRMRGAATVYADVTTLNFNLLFEIGFALGLGLPVRPIRDSSYARDKKAFDALGVLDTLGYMDFTNSSTLAESVRRAGPGQPLGAFSPRDYRETPLYVLKGPVDTDGVVRLLSLLKKSRLRFRTHDQAETPRLSLHKARQQVTGSFGVVAHLLSPQRTGADVHNALSAFVCGLAVAQQKPVLMVQEEVVTQPIDYRDLVQSYESAGQIEGLVEGFLAQVVERLQQGLSTQAPKQIGILNEIDLGDVAAENEIGGLREYFVPTGRFDRIRKGHAQLVIGRKGAGKSAMFYAVRGAVSQGREVIVLDMRPEGHQFTRLREAVLQELATGQQEYVLAAFWTYLLSAEVAHKLINSPRERRDAERDPRRYDAYKRLEDAYLAHNLASSDDLSQRFLRQIDRLSERFKAVGKIGDRTDLAELVYGGDLHTLNDAVAEYVSSEKDELWLLIDNLDKSWATRGSTPEDILILRGLLDASAQLQRQLEQRDVVFRSVVFLRTDVYERLQELTPDRGKESIIRLDWDDPHVFREIVRQRILASTTLTGTFDELWAQIAPTLIGVENSFEYVLDRTLGRPRDLLQFINAAIQVAVDRSHERVDVEDIRHAEHSYSEDMLLALVYEIEDTHPEIAQAIYEFQGAPKTMSVQDVGERLAQAGVPEAEVARGVELLLWYGFLGIERSSDGTDQYAYTVHYNISRLMHIVQTGDGRCIVHPAFRDALDISS